MKRLSVDDLTWEFINEHAVDDNDVVKLKLSDGHVYEDKFHRILLLGMLWQPYRALGVPITAEDIYTLEYITTGMIVNDIQSVQYRKLIESGKYDHLEVLRLMWETINYINQFCQIHLTKYAASISIYGCIQALKHKKIQELIHNDIPSEYGTKVAEELYSERSKEFNKLMADPKVNGDMSIWLLYQAQILNLKQSTQFFMAYGTRADIDNKMFRHVINESSLSGLKSAKDYFTESASAKITESYNNQLVGTVQYFARRLRLNNMGFIHRHLGDCGSTTKMSLYVNDGWGHNFIDKEVYVDGRRIMVTKHNCREIENKTILFRSPMCCLHDDGVCEACCGRATRYPWKYMPEDGIGPYAKTKLSAKIAQRVLSAKHLIETLTMLLRMTSDASEYFVVDHSICTLKLDETAIGTTKGKILRVPCSDTRPLEDVVYRHMTPDAMGKLHAVGVFEKGGEAGADIILSDGSIQIHFSKEFMKHIKDMLPEIKPHNGYWHIPLDKWDLNKPMFRYIAMNDDMRSFASRIEHVFKSELASYTNAANALKAVLSTIYSKISLNIFWLEVICKSLMDHPVDENLVTSFSKLSKGIEGRGVASKLAFEDLNNYFKQADTSTVPKGQTPIDVLFGFNS